jgi:hypothetical protein
MAVIKPVLGNASHLNGRQVADAVPADGEALVWSVADQCYEPGTVSASLVGNIPESQVTSLVSDLALKAPLASPTFTGHPVGVTETPGTNSTRLASTAYADAAVAVEAAARAAALTANEVDLVDGAIALKNGSVFITKGSAAALTLAAPTAGTDDGKALRITDTTGFAHTVTTPSNKINGNKAVATSAAVVGDMVTFVAYNGVWYVNPTTTAFLLS